MKDKAQTLDTADLNRIDSFAHWTPVTIRFSDQDSMDHVNNCAFATYVELSRVLFLKALIDRQQNPGIDFILASLKIDYRRELHFPGTVMVGARVLKLGNKSVTTGYGLFKDKECVATSESVNVFIELAGRKTIQIPPFIRAALEADPMQKDRSPV